MEIETYCYLYFTLTVLVCAVCHVWVCAAHLKLGVE